MLCSPLSGGGRPLAPWDMHELRLHQYGHMVILEHARKGYSCEMNGILIEILTLTPTWHVGGAELKKRARATSSFNLKFNFMGHCQAQV